MAGFIFFKEDKIILSNQQLLNIISFANEVARKIVLKSELKFLKKMQEIEENYWPGMILDIEIEFPKVEEKKFWAKIFYETAREIFERKIGEQQYFFWQTNRIYQLCATAKIFKKAVNEIEPKWFPKTKDFRESSEWAKKD